jgi:N-methylhydantoinase A
MAALGVVEMVDENMANAARVHAIESGKMLEGRTLIAFGGGGPVHATRIAEKLGMDRVLIPSGAGVGSAIGFLRAPMGYEVVRSLYQRLGQFDIATVNAMLAAMAAEAEGVVIQGSFGAPLEQERIAYMRYAGQGHEIPVPLPARPLLPADVQALRSTYEAEYIRLYERTVPGADIEVLSYAVQVVARRDDRWDEKAPPPEKPGPAATRPVRDAATGTVSEWAIRSRGGLGEEDPVAGPAILAEDETSTLVGPGWTARRDAAGFLHLQRGEAA